MKNSVKNLVAANFQWIFQPPVATIRCSLSCLIALGAVALGGPVARASVAYGSINNFDTVNDTGVPAHGFEIELDDLQSADITYTYDWNHYGVPTITEDTTSVPGHTNVFVRYASVQTNGVWAAFTAVPTAPIAPTQGHQFTNPSVNFGGEHFGVGYRGAPTAVKYNWLIDNGAGALIQGPPVNVATPTFTYIPPVGAAAPQVQAAVVPPPPPHPPVLEFGSAGWVKEIRTTSHTNNEVRLRDLISPDPDYPGIKDWRNGEPDEVEVEWQILQIDYNAGNGGANGELVAAAEPLNQSDDVVTRRYEFFQYVGPLDPETGEALGDSVGPDGVHGTGSYSNTVVVGLYLGAQMAGFNAALPLGLIDHLPDGEVNTPYANRSVVIAATTNFTATSSGPLPTGMAFDPVTAQVYGTPTTNGVFTFHVTATATNEPVLTKTYWFSIAPAGAVLPPHSAVDTSASPTNGGTVTGAGVYSNGVSAIVVATSSPGFAFVNWTDNGTPVTNVASYPFTVSVNRSLVANFAGSSTNATKIIGLTGSLVFGNVMTGTTTTATLTIHNTGNTNLAVSGISYPNRISGAWIGTIPAGGSHDVTVSFAPLAVASYGGTVTVTSDATSGISYQHGFGRWGCHCDSDKNHWPGGRFFVWRPNHGHHYHRHSDNPQYR